MKVYSVLILFLLACGSSSKSKTTSSATRQDLVEASGKEEVKTTRQNNIQEQWVRENFEIPAWLLKQLLNVPVMNGHPEPAEGENTVVKYSRESGSKSDQSTYHHYQVRTWNFHYKMTQVIREKQVVTERVTVAWWVWLSIALSGVFLFLKAFYWDRTITVFNRLNPFK